MCGQVCIWLMSFGLVEGTDSTISLPAPHFHKLPTDDASLELLAQIHGHIGPWVVAGARLGAAGRQAVEAEGYFDLHVECRGPLQSTPNSCFLDGLQVATGATLGKRNLSWVEAEDVRVTVTNTRTGKSVVVQPSERLLAILFPQESPDATGDDDKSNAKHQQDTMQAAESLAREVAALPQQEILVVIPSED